MEREFVPGTPEQMEEAQRVALARMRFDPMGYVPPVPRDGRVRDKVIIMGFAGSTRDEAPTLHPDYEAWGMNRLHEVVPVSHYTRWFQIHPRHTWDTKEKAKHLEFMRSVRYPLYLQQVEPDMPTSIAYPRAAVDAAFNPFLPKLPNSTAIRNDGQPYHATSVTWMLALALLEGFPHVEIYGVDMVCDEEYSYQRPSCEFWLGLASALGVNVVIPADSALCTQEWLYGWETRPQMEGVINTPLLQARLQQMRVDRDKAIATVNQIIGSIAQTESLAALLKHRARGGVTGIKASLKGVGASPKGKLIVEPAQQLEAQVVGAKPA